MVRIVGRHIRNVKSPVRPNMNSKNNKISLVTLGCSKNLVDSELISGKLKKKGYSLVQEDEADVIILNTCGFIGDAKKESITTALELLEYKKSGKCKQFFLTGCLVERYSEQLKQEMPEIDGFWGTGSIQRIDELLEAPGIDFKGNPQGTLYDPDSPRELLTSSHSAYVKVSEGCSRTCTFCIIPKMRGLMKSRPVDSIKNEIIHLGNQGVREINLIAQDMTSYGRDIGTSLEEMLFEISDTENIDWLRLHYLYPWGVTESLVELMSADNKILPYIDMPLQHINDRILKLMDRRTNRQKTIDIIEKLRTIPDLTLRSTFIVGFPGETEDEFEELLEFIEEFKFERAGAFKYSREEGTKAALLEGQIEEDIKERRLENLMELQADISYQKNLDLIETKQKAIIDSFEDDQLIARISSQAPEVDGITHIDNKDESLIGNIVDIKITECDYYDLIGEVI